MRPRPPFSVNSPRGPSLALGADAIIPRMTLRFSPAALTAGSGKQASMDSCLGSPAKMPEIIAEAGPSANEVAEALREEGVHALARRIDVAAAQRVAQRSFEAHPT